MHLRSTFVAEILDLVLRQAGAKACCYTTRGFWSQADWFARQDAGARILSGEVGSPARCGVVP